MTEVFTGDLVTFSGVRNVSRGFLERAFEVQAATTMDIVWDLAPRTSWTVEAPAKIRFGGRCKWSRRGPRGHRNWRAPKVWFFPKIQLNIE